MSDEQRNRAYLLAAHGAVWACEMSRMRGYLNTPFVSDASQAEIEERTGPRFAELFEADGTRIECPDNTLEAAVAARKSRKAIAVVPMLGPITQRSSVFSMFFGGTATEKFGALLDALVGNEGIGAIVFDVDSPGGTVSGVPELADKIRQAREVKPIIAVANGWMASAAYWLGSQATEVVVSPSGETGSIGVWSMHVDMSAALEQMGVDVTIISAGKYKVEANPYEPLSDEALAYEQTQVGEWYDDFVKAVAKGRAASATDVRAGYGEGRLVRADESVKTGLANRKATLADTIRRLGGNILKEDQIAASAAAREKQIADLEGRLGLTPDEPVDNK